MCHGLPTEEWPASSVANFHSNPYMVSHFRQYHWPSALSSTFLLHPSLLHALYNASSLMNAIVTSFQQTRDRCWFLRSCMSCMAAVKHMDNPCSTCNIVGTGSLVRCRALHQSLRCLNRLLSASGSNRLSGEGARRTLIYMNSNTKELHSIRQEFSKASDLFLPQCQTHRWFAFVNKHDFLFVKLLSIRPPGHSFHISKANYHSANVNDRRRRSLQGCSDGHVP